MTLYFTTLYSLYILFCVNSFSSVMLKLQAKVFIYYSQQKPQNLWEP